jgi:hypothetical protein
LAQKDNILFGLLKLICCDAYDGAGIADNVSEISATSSLRLSDIYDEFSAFESQSNGNYASRMQNHQPINEEIQTFDD